MKIVDLCAYAPKSAIKAGEAMKDGKYIFFTSSDDESKRYSDYQHNCEAIIMGTGGNATLHYYNGKFSTSTDCVVLLPNESIRCKFLYYFFLHNIAVLEKGFKGAGLKHTNKNYINNIEINTVPDIETQDKVIKALDLACNLVRFHQRQLKKLDELVKSRFIELFGDPVSNPKDWNVVPLGKRCEIITGNTPSRSEPENYGEYIEWIKSDNINTPFTFITKAQECLSEAGFEKCRFVEAGSILMTCIAGSINCIGNVAVTDRRVAFNQQINAIVPKQDEVLYLFWLMQLSKPMIHRTINMALKGILSKSQLSEIAFPFPPITLQEQFAAFVEQTDKSKFVIQQALDKAQLLFDSLMQKYFGYR